MSNILVMNILVCVFCLFILWLMYKIIYYIIDSSFLIINESNGVVVGKYIKPIHTYKQPVKIGEITTIQTHHHGAKYKLIIEIDKLTDNVLTVEPVYSNIKRGQSIKCKYSIGRFSKSLYIHDIYSHTKYCNIF